MKARSSFYDDRFRSWSLAYTPIIIYRIYIHIYKRIGFEAAVGLWSRPGPIMIVKPERLSQSKRPKSGLHSLPSFSILFFFSLCFYSSRIPIEFLCNILLAEIVYLGRRYNLQNKEKERKSVSQPPQICIIQNWSCWKLEVIFYFCWKSFFSNGIFKYFFSFLLVWKKIYVFIQWKNSFPMIIRIKSLFHYSEA